MKKIHFLFLSFFLIFLFSACSATKKNSSKNEEKTVWVKSTYLDTVSYGDANSGLYQAICIGINKEEN